MEPKVLKKIQPPPRMDKRRREGGEGQKSTAEKSLYAKRRSFGHDGAPNTDQFNKKRAKGGNVNKRIGS